MNSTERFKIVMDILDKNDLCNNTINHMIFDKLKDDEFKNEDKIAEIITCINVYNEKIESNNNRYPEVVMQALRQRNDLEEYDISMDEELNKIDPDKAFSEVCIWNGLLGGWDSQIKDWINGIYGVKLGED